MHITLDTTTASADELTALIALLASLGGRLPSKGVGQVHVDVVARPNQETIEAIEETRRLMGRAPADQAEALLQQEAARVAAASDESDGPVFTTAGQVDADGIPWDDRIHSSNKARNADNTWRKKRGVDEVTYGRVHAELQAQYADPNRATGTQSNGAASPVTDSAPVASAPPPPATLVAAPPPPVEPVGNAPVAPSAPTADAPPAPTPAVSAPAAGNGRFADFPAFVQAVNTIRTPGIPYLELNTYAQTVGVAGGFKDMKDRPDLWETFYGMAGGQ